MWVLAVDGFVIAIFCVVAFVHGASIRRGGRTTLDIGYKSGGDAQHRDAA